MVKTTLDFSKLMGMFLLRRKQNNSKILTNLFSFILIIPHQPLSLQFEEWNRNGALPPNPRPLPEQLWCLIYFSIINKDSSLFRSTKRSYQEKNYVERTSEGWDDSPHLWHSVSAPAPSRALQVGKPTLDYVSP